MDLIKHKFNNHLETGLSRRSVQILQRTERHRYHIAVTDCRGRRSIDDGCYDGEYDGIVWVLDQRWSRGKEKLRQFFFHLWLSFIILIEIVHQS
jgi:hypothetical protein